MKGSTNWVAIEGPSLTLIGSGSGGLAELHPNLADDKIAYVFFRAIGSDVQANVTSNREKFIFISYIGKSVGALKRARVGMQSRDVQTSANKLRLNFAISVDASDIDDLSVDALSKRLLACGGAHKPTKYVFGPGQEYSLVEAGLLGAAGPRAAFVPSSEAKAPEAAPEAAPAE